MGRGGAHPLGLRLQQAPDPLKKELPWLRETPAQSLQQVDADLDHAFKAFFANARRGRVVSRRRNPATGRVKNPYGHPQFHGKGKAKDSITFMNQDGCVRVEAGRPRLPKMPGTLKVVWSRPVESTVKRATVSRDRAGDYWVSVLCDGLGPEPVCHPRASVGVDVGVRALAVLSTGEVVQGVRALADAQKRLARLQRRLSRKRPGSANHRKLRVRIARLHRRVARLRRDLHDKAATSIAKTYGAVCVEDLATKGWWRDGRLVKGAQDLAPAQFLRLLEERCERYGARFQKVGRYYPSTQTCSACGARTGPKGASNLGVREWTCPVCGARHDRDVNAARNIEAEGLRLLAERGAGTASAA